MSDGSGGGGGRQDAPILRSLARLLLFQVTRRLASHRATPALASSCSLLPAARPRRGTVHGGAPPGAPRRQAGVPLRASTPIHRARAVAHPVLGGGGGAVGCGGAVDGNGGCVGVGGIIDGGAVAGGAVAGDGRGGGSGGGSAAGRGGGADAVAVASLVNTPSPSQSRATAAAQQES